MRRRWIAAGLLLMAVGGCALRPPLGRSRPDLAALLSFDGHPLTFAHTYTDGQVGPFSIGETRASARKRLLALPLLDQDRPQLTGGAPVWSIALPARSGSYSVYNVTFRDERVASVEAFSSVFAGL
ncbi:hypothetical protein [Sphingosinicella sp. BN140058]|uniref:hypothetical protein n=1 Tax=Sphingosinicella sp. BN140058 TaxID=1892855 RepID=UPI0010119DBD|nr:hypothetical protein [Sphingosinicella sp. BN140058]QAY78488.1 hypothetical protein ETR14_19530 [Sphingosinicella sp. BN140058]